MDVRSVAVLLVLGLCLTAGACVDPSAGGAGTPTASSQPTSPASDPPPTALTGSGGTFRYGIGEPSAIIPPLAATTDDRAVVDAVFDSLTAWDVAGRPVPAAATSWQAAEGATLWTFTLRADATFHDGAPVTATDFVTAWTMLVRDGPAGYLLQDVVGYQELRQGDAPTLAGVQAVSGSELQVRLVRPRADLPIVVGHPALGPVAAGLQAADPAAYAELPVGNGPFRLTEPWARGDFIRAGRWDGWLNGERSEDTIAEVVFRIADLDINFLAFGQGRRDFTAVPPDALELAAQEYPRQGGEWSGPGLITGSRPEAYLLAINRQVPPFTDVAVREAVSLVIDRTRIAAENAAGNLTGATSLLPAGLPGFRRDSCERCTFNPSGADERLEEAGVRQLDIAFNAGGGHERIRNVLRGDLSDIGVSLVSNGRAAPPSPAEYQARLAAGDVGMFRLPLSADVPSGLDVLHPLLHGDRTPEAGGQNYMRYDDPTVTALLDQAATTLDDVTRERLIRRVEDLALNRDQVLVPVVTYHHAVVAAEEVRNLRYGPFGLLNLTELSLGGR